MGSVRIGRFAVMNAKELAALVDLLGDENPEIVEAVRGRLDALGRAALPALREALASDDPKRRLRARAAERDILSRDRAEDLAAYLAKPDVDLEAAALMLALVENPGLDLAQVRARLDELAARVAERAAHAEGAAGRAAALGAVLHGEEGFHGNEKDYYDPANSYLDLVIDRRAGIPITLSILYLLVGWRAGLKVHGINFPRHFVVGFTDGDFSTAIDPFHEGRLLDRQALAARVFAQNLPWNDSYLAEATPRDVMRRMLGNLAFVYRDRADRRRLARIEALLEPLDRRTRTPKTP
jgi:regulator of sirC expression with transglutaminase-like and TPR domain